MMRLSNSVLVISTMMVILISHVLSGCLTQYHIFINDGTGQFSYIETSGLDKLYNYMVVEDLDNDGDTDLVLCGYNNSIRIFENTGDANFRLKST